MINYLIVLKKFYKYSIILSSVFVTKRDQSWVYVRLVLSIQFCKCLFYFKILLNNKVSVYKN